MSAYVVVVEGLDSLQDIEDLEKKALTAARQAINKAARHARAVSAKAMQEQINFPARYLSGKDGKLQVSRFAQGRKLEAAITGRDRPTSLARFAPNKTTGRRKGGVQVAVKPGQKATLRRAFLMNLKGGNLGLAIRSPERPSAAYAPKRIGQSNIWLLYGPSVDQVFKAVAREDGGPAALDLLEREFNRLMKLQ